MANELQELLSTLHVIVGHLNDLNPATAMEQLRQTKYVADLNNSDWGSPLKICDDSELSRCGGPISSDNIQGRLLFDTSGYPGQRTVNPHILCHSLSSLRTSQRSWNW